MSVNGQPCKWWKHAEVVAQLRAVGEAGVSLQVVSLLPSPEPRGTVSPSGTQSPYCTQALVLHLGTPEASKRGTNRLRAFIGVTWQWPPMVLPCAKEALVHLK